MRVVEASPCLLEAGASGGVQRFSVPAVWLFMCPFAGQRGQQHLAHARASGCRVAMLAAVIAAVVVAFVLLARPRSTPRATSLHGAAALSSASYQQNDALVAHSPLLLEVALGSSNALPPAPDTTAPLVCLGIPVSSRDRHGNVVHADVRKQALFRTLMQSMLSHSFGDVRSPRFRKHVLLAMDDDDPVFAGQRNRVRHEFNRLMGVHRWTMEALAFNASFRGAPAWLWDELFVVAMRDRGCAYFYQIGDDVELTSDGWLGDFWRAIERTGNISDSGISVPGVSPSTAAQLGAHWGVAGPFDTRNPHTLTQALVPRSHFDAFGFLYPRVFRNWYSDEWLYKVYLVFGRSARFREHEVVNQNTAGARYHHDAKAGGLVDRQVAAGVERLTRFCLESRAEGCS